MSLLSASKATCVLFACASIAFGQLHIVTGTPTPKHNEKFGSVIYRVDEDGSILAVNELVKPEVGTDWISLSYQMGKLVLEAYGRTMIAVDFAHPDKVKACQAPSLPGSVIDQWLADIPSVGPFFLRLVAGDTPETHKLQGMNLDPAIPCEASFSIRPPEDLRYAKMHGSSGVGSAGTSTRTAVAVDPGGQVSARYYSQSLPTDLSVPKGALATPKEGITWLMVDDENLYVISGVRSEGKTGKVTRRDIVACLKPTNRCQSIVGLTDTVGLLRGFGKYVAVTEGRVSTSSQSGFSHAGEGEWRQKAGRFGPSVALRMTELTYSLPGRIHLFNAETGQVHTIKTFQADSEVLLVDNGFVYYRASDRLYKTELTADGVTNTRMIARSEIIRDAHWAFMPR